MHGSTVAATAGSPRKRGYFGVSARVAAAGMVGFHSPSGSFPPRLVSGDFLRKEALPHTADLIRDLPGGFRPLSFTGVPTPGEESFKDRPRAAFFLSSSTFFSRALNPLPALLPPPAARTWGPSLRSPRVHHHPPRGRHCARG